MPASPQVPPPSFDRRRIGNTIAVDGVGSPGRVEEIDGWFEEERSGWERRVRYLEEEVHRLRCKGKEDEGRHNDGLRIDPRGDVVIHGVGGVDEGVAPTDLSSNSILKEGGVSEDAGEERETGPTSARSTPASSCSRTDLAFCARASFYYRQPWSLGQAELGPPSSYYCPPAA